MACVLSKGEIEHLLQNDTTSVSTNLCPSLNPIIHNMQNKTNERNIIIYINKQLSKSTNRDIGFNYLNAVLAYCSMETLSENATIWINHAVANQRGLPSPRFTFLSNIMILCQNNQDFNKIMTSTYLSKVVEVSISIPEVKTQPAAVLHCLKNCLQIYSSSCGPMKNKIESYLLNILSLNICDRLMLEAGKCHHFLQQVGAGGPESTNHVNNWSLSVKRLCRTMNGLYDNLFENKAELKTYVTINVAPYVFPEHSSDTSAISLLTITEHRLNNVCLFLRAMFETKYHVTKVVNPQNLLNLFERSLSLHSCVVMETHSLEASHFSVLLMKHQMTIYYLFRSFIAMLHLNLIPFSSIITKMLLESLVRTKKCSCFNNNSDYKDSLYKVLIYWIRVMKNNLNDKLYDKIILAIIDDIRPLKTEVSLSMANTENQGESPRTKIRTIESRILASSMSSDKGEYSECYLAVRQQVSCNALKCLTCIFQNVRVNVEQDTLHSVYNTVMKSLLEIQNGITVVPYTGEESQLMLYETLLAITNPSISNVPSPIELALNIFLVGQRSNNFKISQICSNGLKTLERMCQPICPVLSIRNESICNDHNSEFGNRTVNIIERGQIFNEDLENENDKDSGNISIDAASGSVEVEATEDTIEDTTEDATEDATADTSENEPHVTANDDEEKISNDSINKEIEQIASENCIKCSPRSTVETPLSITNDCEISNMKEDSTDTKKVQIKSSPTSSHDEMMQITQIQTEVDIKTSPMTCASIIVKFDSSDDAEIEQNLETSLSTSFDSTDDGAQPKRKSTSTNDDVNDRFLDRASPTLAEQPLIKKAKLKDPNLDNMMDSFVDVVNEPLI